MHNVFISYHHDNDQQYKNELSKYNKIYFNDYSVDTGDINDNLSDQDIREKIRDEYLRDSSVTIVLIGEETKNRKHVDWEIYSSMYDGAINKKSGILLINLPTISSPCIACSKDEELLIDPNASWSSISNNYESYVYYPKRILTNLRNNGCKISAVNYKRIIDNPDILPKLLDIAYYRRTSNIYDLTDPMRRHNG